MEGPGAVADDGEASHLVTGLRLPAIPLPSTDGGLVDLSVMPGRSVLWVYPWTGRPGLPNPPHWDDIAGAHGSTPEAEGFRALSASYRRAGVLVFGLSGQSTDYQREFVDRLALPFPLLSDHGFRFADTLRLPRFETGGVTYLRRLTLLVEDGRIARCFYPVPVPASHAEELLATLG